jgi:hypothetical protein
LHPLLSKDVVFDEIKIGYKYMRQTKEPVKTKIDIFLPSSKEQHIPNSIGVQNNKTVELPSLSATFVDGNRGSDNEAIEVPYEESTISNLAQQKEKPQQKILRQ